MNYLGWEKLDVILITGDTYIDSYYNGAALIGKLLIKEGFKVGIIAQPEIKSGLDITRLGEPKLFWGVSAGAVDSMVANYTATKKPRKKDDFTPGGINNRRPDRATIVYTNLIKKYYKKTMPIVLGGIEASLRRIVHYDYWQDKLRRSILFDAKADILVYGMAEKSIVEIAGRLKENKSLKDVKGICFKSSAIPTDYLKLPSFEEVKEDKFKFIEMFHTFYKNTRPEYGKGLYQLQDTQYLIQNPPAEYLTGNEMDEIYGLPFENQVHPFYRKQGKTNALDTVKFSITSHRGCFGECNFCSIAAHQGVKVQSRSQGSIISEAEKMAQENDFKGIINNLGGPTANMMNAHCKKHPQKEKCKDKRCLHPTICSNLKLGHDKQIEILKKITQIPQVKKVFIRSGIRHDLILYDKKNGDDYLKTILSNHISGQMKIAPEHISGHILSLMEKSSNKTLEEFLKKFKQISDELKSKQFLTYYLMAAHPDCTLKDMKDLKRLVKNKFKIRPEQVQIFTPTPSTYSTLMYYTKLNPFNLKPIFVETKQKEKEAQKAVITNKD